MTHNLFSPFGSSPLRYPHYTAWDDKTNTVKLVTSPVKDDKGDDTFSYFYKPVVVTNINETRPAKGEHKTNFKPVYQSVTFV